MMIRLFRGLLLAVCLLPSASIASAQEPDSVTIVAGLRYRTGGPLGWLARWIFGSRNRQLWSAPVRVEAIDPDQWRGGIRLLGADTGLRTGYQYYRDSTGETWTFRALDRDLTSFAPDRFREAAMSGFFQDLYSARHPGAPLVWPTLARAAGVGVVSERLVALVDDSVTTLGYLDHGIETRFRMELEDPGAAISSAALVDSLEQARPPAIDTLQYLRERLFDLYLGSWDPLPEEWLWRYRDGMYRPLPRDRDGAFARFDGLVASMAATGWAELASFEPDYTGRLPVTARTRVLDRRILTALDPPQWIPVAIDLRSRLTDSVIEAAVAHLPPEYYRLNGPMLLDRLKSRRDALPEAAQRFRLLVIEEADLYGTQGSDSVVADFAADSVLRVRMAGRADRTFHVTETERVRLFLLGGTDYVLMRGSGVLGPLLEVSAHPELTLVDSSLARPFELRHDLKVPQVQSAVEAPLVSGSRVSFVPWLDVGSDLGVLVGFGLVRTSYDPAWAPWQRRMRLRVGYASSPSVFGAEFRGEFPFRNSARSIRIDAKASGLEILRYYGYGNETERTEDKEFYRTDQQHLVFAPSLVLPVNGRVTAEVGPIVKRVTTQLDRDNKISEDQPYGATEDGFSQVGIQGAFQLDSRDFSRASTTGWLIRLGATAYTGLLDTQDPFGYLDAAVSSAITPLAPLTVSARLAGRWSWGEYPVHEASYLGGSNSVRSLTSQRFAGDAALWANVDARLRLTSLPFVVRWDFGLLGIADVGRVYYATEQSQKWHPGLGGGLWMALPDRSFMGVLQLVTGPEGLRFSAGSRFIF